MDDLKYHRFHSLIIKRACNFSDSKDGFSLTCVLVASGTEKQLNKYLLTEEINESCMDHDLPSEFHWYAGALSRGRKYCFKM